MKHRFKNQRDNDMTHAEREARDAAFMADYRAVPPFQGGFTHAALRQQVATSTALRRVLVKHFPEMRPQLNALPELEKV